MGPCSGNECVIGTCKRNGMLGSVLLLVPEHSRKKLSKEPVSVVHSKPTSVTAASTCYNMLKAFSR